MIRWRAAILLGIAALMCAAAGRLPVIQDEAYYWTWAQAPALSYFDHPPGVAWVLASSTAIFGDGHLGLRLPSLLAIGASLSLAAAAARRRAGANASWLAVWILLGSPMVILGYLPGTHDPLLGAAAALAAYAILRAVEDPTSQRWAAAAGLVLASSVALKHSAALLALGVLGGLLVTPGGRAALARPAPWIGAAIGAIPVAAWWWADGGRSLDFQVTRVFTARSRGLEAIPLTLGSMMATLGPVTVVAAGKIAAGALGARRDPAACAAAGGALALILGCTVAVWAGSGEANWPTPALVLLAPWLAAGVEGRWRRATAIGAATWTAAGVALLIHAIHPWLPIPPAKDPIHRGAGFDRVASAAEEAAKQHQASMILTRRYQPASLLRYHTRDRLAVLELGTPGGRRSQYDRWPRRWPCPGEVVVTAWLDPAPPPEISLQPLAEGTPVLRAIAGRTIERWWVRPWRVGAPAHPSCERR